MKAIICTKYGPPEVLKLVEVEKPVPKANEVLVRIHATAVTASDCIIRGFNVPLSMKISMGLAIGFRKPRRPILGMVMAGEIESVGVDVELFKAGEQIIGGDYDRFDFGMYADYVCMPEDGMMTIKPSNLTYEEAAAIPYGGLLALYYLKKGDIKNRGEVLIYGASGAIGTSAVQLAKHFGTEVTGVCSASNLDLVRSLGADHVIDYKIEDFSHKGERYDLILNAVGKRKAKLSMKNSLNPNGVHVTVDDGSPKYSIGDIEFIKELVETEKIRPVIDRVYPLEQIVEAHRYVDLGHKKGNVVITVESN